MIKYVYGEDQFEYKGYTYAPEDDIEEDCVKRFHRVYRKHKGVRIDSESVPLSPYSSLSEAQFIRWIDMGKPTRKQMGGHDLIDHEMYFNKFINEIANKVLLGVNNEYEHGSTRVD